MSYRKNGFTLIEVSIASLLLVVLGMGILGLQQVMQGSQFTGITNYSNVEEANYVLTQMAREMRTMRSGQNGAYAFIYGDAYEVSFYADINFDGVSERVRYWLDGTTLYKSITRPSGFPPVYQDADTITRPVAENVRNADNPVFLYFNDSWPSDTVNNPLAMPVNIAEVRLIRISLDVNVNPDNPRQTYSLSTNASLRMLKDNL